MIGARVHRGSLIAPPRVFCVSECAKWEDAHFSLCITARREDKGSWIMLRLYVSCLSPKPLPALPAQPQPEVTGFPGTWKWNHSTRAALMSLHISSLTGLDVIVSLCCLFFVFFPRPDVPCHVCTSVVTMHEGDSKRTRGGWACEKWMPFWMHERRRARVMCHRGGGGRPENVDLTPVPQLFSFPIQRSLILRDSALSKHIRVMTHIPGTTCSAEAHFSMLRDMLRGQWHRSRWMDEWKDQRCVAIELNRWSVLVFSPCSCFFFFCFHASSSFNHTQLLSFQSIESGGQTFWSGPCAGKIDGNSSECEV